MTASSIVAGEVHDNRMSRRGSIAWYEYEWTSHSTTGVIDASLGYINGIVVAVETNPDGTAAPTNLYDLKVQDDWDYDIMGGALTDRSETAVERAYPSVVGSGTKIGFQPPVAGTLTLVGADCGNSTKGKIRIFVK